MQAPPSSLVPTMSERPRADIEHFRNGKDVEIERSHLESHQHGPGGSISFGESSSGMKIKSSMLNFSVGSPGSGGGSPFYTPSPSPLGGPQYGAYPYAFPYMNGLQPPPPPPQYGYGQPPAAYPNASPGAYMNPGLGGPSHAHVHPQAASPTWGGSSQGQYRPGFTPTHPSSQPQHSHSAPANLNPSRRAPGPSPGNQHRRDEDYAAESDSEESETSSDQEKCDSHRSDESDSESEQSRWHTTSTRTKVAVSKSAPAMAPDTNTVPIPVIVEPRNEEDEDFEKSEEASQPVPALAAKKTNTTAEIAASEPAPVVSSTPTNSTVETQPEAQPIAQPVPVQAETTAASSLALPPPSASATAMLAASEPTPVLPSAAPSNTTTEPQNVISADHFAPAAAAAAPPSSTPAQPALLPPTTIPAWTPPTPSPTPPPVQRLSPSQTQTPGSSLGGSTVSKGKEKRWIFSFRSSKRTEESAEDGRGSRERQFKETKQFFLEEKRRTGLTRSRSISVVSSDTREGVERPDEKVTPGTL
ncbi:unnamed protein product [Cyclocybe aegerita]|uniref:Uncharacterized protein n=1 Tax=Cyclocybe aegerita TaxID=1973307 RepID=A0A8S0VS27_CYCAE|nr:unnamed protein product [Cyclocybe aegerita]